MAGLAPLRHLVLAGGGHSHALLLRRWAMQPQRRPQGWLISLVSRHSTALYSGMVPGLIAGLYRRQECAIDLRRLCRAAGVAFLRTEISGLDVAGRQVLLEGRPPLAYGCLSLDVGAITATVAPEPSVIRQGQPTTEVATETSAPTESPLPIKPLEPFLAWWEGQTPLPSRLWIRGGGAAAVEVALAMAARGQSSGLRLRGDHLHLGSLRAERRAERWLAEAGVAIERQCGEEAAATLACTGSRAPAWLAAAGLPVEPASGRVLTEASLQVQGEPLLFASGDCGLIAAAPRPASGVWAVRAAALLARNLERRLQDPNRPLLSWRPQRRALQLLGDGGAGGRRPKALALWGPWCLGPNGWLWRWKQRIDRRFMERFNALAPMAASGMAGSGGDAAVMACRGCGAKLAAAPLAAALAAQGPGRPVEDAAVLGKGAGGEWLLQSVDGFPALVDDPWLNGRLTALHACTDIWARGAQVSSAQLLVTLPAVAADLQAELLAQSLAGVRSELEPLGAELVGGHSLEARSAPPAAKPASGEIVLALTVNGEAPPQRLWGKGPLQPGDRLLLSRALGTGVLFAAAMRGEAEPEWLDQALAAMEQPQAPLVELLERHSCRACTDITGFGLLGHLGEMLAASSGVIVELAGAAIPALRGARTLLERGLASSLAPSNAEALSLLAPAGPVRLKPAESGETRWLQGLVTDPQTCGPLLATLPEAQAKQALQEIRAMGFTDAALVGRVVHTNRPY